MASYPANSAKFLSAQVHRIGQTMEHSKSKSTKHRCTSRWMGHPTQYRFPSICYVPKMSDQNCQESTRKICFSGVQLGCRRRGCCRVQPVQPSGREEAVRRCRAGRRPRRTARGRRGQRAPLLQPRKTRILLSHPGTKLNTLNNLHPSKITRQITQFGDAQIANSCTVWG